jgi:hypothetical protein
LTVSNHVRIVARTLRKLRGFAFLSIGLGLLAGAAWRGSVVREFAGHANTAEAVVYATPHGGSHPAIRFNDVAGKVVEYPQGGLIFGYHVGDRVKVLYEAQAPRDTACIDTFGALWFTPLILVLLGLGLTFARGRIALSVFVGALI